ncbi:lipoprotein insertase outer membrane protein LolB [Colwellia sp. UCD-KL20]|uniref:lipoprotein insertase outer membrane protein LolB n=1 Tax=Colwellia sp. UCD-KL20 TaxID=1917165 RepID=UPI0015C39861|nr:lipoprotein insertase outer membrane protein LolB [Colwellia sp. UCD-KL20]
MNKLSCRVAMHLSINQSYILVFFIVLLTGCISTQPVNDIDKAFSSDIKKREVSLAKLNVWEIKGKIAFINSTERKSASIYWKKSKNTQQLNLTTYLGINVLKLTSNENIHTIEIDGEEYQSNNLDSLIESLTDITFPTEALKYWIKAIPYNENDTFTFDPNSKLPLTLTSHYNSHDWTIQYSSYQRIQQDKLTLTLPNKIKVTSADLTINIAINNWAI